MCERTDSVRAVHKAATHLAMACAERTLRQHYNAILEEETPPEWAELLKRLK